MPYLQTARNNWHRGDFIATFDTLDDLLGWAAEYEDEISDVIAELRALRPGYWRYWKAYHFLWRKRTLYFFYRRYHLLPKQREQREQLEQQARVLPCHEN